MDGGRTQRRCLKVDDGRKDGKTDRHSGSAKKWTVDVQTDRRNMKFEKNMKIQRRKRIQQPT